MAIARIETDGIEDGAVDSSKILDGILGAADIPNDTLTNTKFSNSAAIPTSKLTGLATSATTDTTSATNITSGSLATARVNVGTTAGKILQVDGSGNMPAIDGSQLTGVESFTKSASDPTISTNPSGGVGTEWVNTTNGEIYICTDATAGENVWTNVGAGSGNIQTLYQGTQKGYTCGGDASNVIDWFSFTSDGNATDWADLQTSSRYAPAGHSSSTYGYASGGQPNHYIEKYPFASQTNATTVGILTTNAARDGISETSDTIYAFAAGGGAASYFNVIDRFPYATDSDASDVGDLLFATMSMAGASSTSHGYAAGGGTTGSPYRHNQIQKYSFAASANSTDVADLTGQVVKPNGHQSDTHGYKSGGYTGSYTTGADSIQKWSFASDANSTNVGTTIQGRSYAGAHSSTTYGYSSGGAPPTNVIEKFAFATDSNGTDVGDLTVTRGYICGNQY